MLLKGRWLVIVSFCLATLGMAHAEENLKPFVLAWQGAASPQEKAEEVKESLTKNGFEVVGQYSPDEGVEVIVATNDALKSNAAASEMGGFGAMQRVSVTKAGDMVQVAYTNPVYMANAYRMKGDLKDVAAALASALGNEKGFGSEDGIPASKLRKYHYMFGMPYFDDPDELASYDSYEAGVEAVEKGLAAGRGGVSKVYRIDIPGKKETVFGVHMTDGCSGDSHTLDKVDFGELKHTAHLPYELLVSGDKAYALNARFRIAIDFPDLGMVGEHSFMSIMCAPDAITHALTSAAGGRT